MQQLHNVPPLTPAHLASQYLSEHAAGAPDVYGDCVLLVAKEYFWGSVAPASNFFSHPDNKNDTGENMRDRG